MCKDRDAFIEYADLSTARNVNSAKNNASSKVLGQGTVVLRVWNGTFSTCARLENTLHVQDLNKNLFSLTAATARGMKIEINSAGCIVFKSGQIVATGVRRGILLTLIVEEVPQCHVLENEAELWHRRLGHISYSTINKLIKDGCIKA
uniref:GAG-pre-integrase domain-containing protein n=1 Tax=Peronospora matthiolae TaxID=2874970 RepID=A0AAV1T735_9STRA